MILIRFSFFLLVDKAAIESIQRWSELHQKQEANSTLSSDEQAYLSVVSKACYAVFDYPQGWLIDTTVSRNIRLFNNENVLLIKNVHQTLADHANRQMEINILRQKCIPILTCNLLRIYDLIKQDEEIFRLMIFLSDHRQQQLYSVGSHIYLLHSKFHFIFVSYSRKKH